VSCRGNSASLEFFVFPVPPGGRTIAPASRRPHRHTGEPPMPRKLIGLLAVLVALGPATTLLAAGGDKKGDTPPKTPLWPDGAPGAVGENPEDIPTVTVYLAPADKANGTAVVICPGGGYGALAM